MQGVDLFWMLRVLRQKSRSLFFLLIVISLISYLIASVLPGTYQAKTSLLIRQSAVQPFSSSLANLGGLSPFGLQLGSQGSIATDLIDLLRSNRVLDQVIEEAKLRSRLKDWEDQETLRSKVRGMVLLPSVIKTNLVEIKVLSQDPELAALLTNQYVDVLRKTYLLLSTSQAAKKRSYIEAQLPRLSKALSRSEDKLRNFTSLLPIGNGEQSEMNVDYAAIPSVELIRLRREMELTGTVYAMLRREHEAARLEESKDLEPFQVLDRAEVPNRPVSPRKLRVTLMMSMLALFVGATYYISKEVQMLPQKEQNFEDTDG